MNLIKLGDKMVLNTDSVVSIEWQGVGKELVAVVKYLAPSAPDKRGGPGLLSEKLTGNTAQALYEWASQQSAGAAGISTETTSSRRNRTPQTRVPRPQFLHMLTSGLLKNKSWYYLKDSNRAYFLAMVNAKGSCSMRTYDAETGAFLGKQYARGKFQEQFADYVRNARELTINRQPNLERDCVERLPEEVLSSFKMQVSTR
jgi:hypothetical protein